MTLFGRSRLAACLALFAVLAVTEASDPQDACEGEDCPAVDVAPKGGVGMLQRKTAAKTLQTAAEDRAEDQAQQSQASEDVEESELALLSNEEVDAAELRRAKLVVEGDLSKMGDEHFLAYDSGATCHQNAERSFDHFSESSGLVKEMREGELKFFRKRFLSEMDWDCEHDPDVSKNWAKDVRVAVQNEKPQITQAKVDRLNAAHRGIRFVMRDWMAHQSALEYTRKLGLKMTPEQNESVFLQMQEFGKRRTETAKIKVPSSFDPRAQWPACAEVIGRIHDQNACGSCWAFGALSAVDSRVCIESGGQWSGPNAQLSRGHVTSCAYTHNGEQGRDGCAGAWPPIVFNMLEQHGVVTGGDQGCQPYFGTGRGVDHFVSSNAAPPCRHSCKAGYRRSFSGDGVRLAGIGSTAQVIDVSSPSTSRSEGNAQAKLAMYRDGPITYTMNAGGSFQGYRSGVWNMGCDSGLNHAVTAIGWGPGYIVSLNSWGPWWGNKGGFNIGENCVFHWIIPGKITGTNLRSLLPIPGGRSGTWRPTPAPTPPPCPWWRFWCGWR